MKSYILTSKVKFDEKDIANARAWEKMSCLGYEDDIAQLMHEYMTTGRAEFEIEEVEIEEIK